MAILKVLSLFLRNASTRAIASRSVIFSYIAVVARQAQGVVTGAFFVLVYLGFLLASQGGFRRKMVNMFPDGKMRGEALEVFHRVRGGVEGYIWVQTVTGAMICAAAWVLMRLERIISPEVNGLAAATADAAEAPVR